MNERQRINYLIGLNRGRARQKKSGQSSEEKLAYEQAKQDIRGAEYDRRQRMKSLIPTRDIASEKETARQDRLEKIYGDRLAKVVSFRSGGLGLQDMKVNQAIDLLALVDRYYDPKTDEFKIPPSLHAELALGLARLVSPSGNVGIELMQELRQVTAQEGLAGLAIWAGADPKEVGGTSQSVARVFVDSIVRQGLISERLRDKYMQDLRNMVPAGLNEESKSRLHSMYFGSSFSKEFQNSPVYHTLSKDIENTTQMAPSPRSMNTQQLIPSSQSEDAVPAGYTRQYSPSRKQYRIVPTGE